MGLESSPVMKPSRSARPAIRISPIIRASIPASATARCELPRASGRTAAAIMGARDESGPSTRTRDGPNNAYASNGTMVAYRPVTGGNPAAAA
jgi:hypothetical protein